MKGSTLEAWGKARYVIFTLWPRASFEIPLLFSWIPQAFSLCMLVYSLPALILPRLILVATTSFLLSDDELAVGTYC